MTDQAHAAGEEWKPPDPEDELALLVGFQRAAVDHAFHRLYEAPDATHRFLVADEVGLGKTLIARGLLARAIERLHREGVRRIDVIYICSNQQIASQNIRRLNLLKDSAFVTAERITLLPLTLGELERRHINFVALTPGTSLEPKSRLGTRRERLLLHHLLEAKWHVGGTGPLNLLQGNVAEDRFREAAGEFAKEHQVSAGLTRAFHAALDTSVDVARQAGQPDLETRYRDLCAAFRVRRDEWPKDLARARAALVGDLRAVLARTCIEALQPDLVILDEFQRFKHLLETGTEAAELADQLFNYSDEHTKVRILLLSATPYKMYTLAHEKEEDDHYEDFLRTVRFLDPDPQRHAQFKKLLGEWRRAFFRLGDEGPARLRELRAGLESHLRRVMSRTERVGAAGDRDAMLREATGAPPRLQPADAAAFVPLQRIAREIGRPRLVEFWKSAPYPLNFMDEYLLKEDLHARLKAADQGRLPELFAQSQQAGALIDGAAIERYAQLTVPHPALRALVEDLAAKDAFRCLWLPPTLPYWQLQGAFATARAADLTKRLVFSAWNVVPRALASLLSYEAERRLITAVEGAAPPNTPEARKRRQSFLSLSLKDGQPADMSAFTLLYPSAVLAQVGDPLAVATGAATAGPAGLASRPLEAVLREIEERLRTQLAALAAQAGGSGQPDLAWHWAAPILLDRQDDEATTCAFWKRKDLAATWASGDGGEEDEEANAGWSRHVERVQALLDGRVQLGPMPPDLPAVLARIALGAPATAALRALRRLGHPALAPPSLLLRDAAATVGWAFRSLLKRPESVAAIRAGRVEQPYWLSALEYGCEGGLTAVLDEWFHLLRELEGLFKASAEEAAPKIAAAAGQALTLRATRHDFDLFDVGRARVEPRRHSLRAHFALRFGSEKSDEQAQVQREGQVRSAFNSPFWPFVLCSTSVGQEGLDFHPWCHAVVHWNLPANPVDLEQREGRVHRFKNHAVRKNVAAQHGGHGLTEVAAGRAGDPWCSGFEEARRVAPPGHRGLVPHWMFPREGGAAIERHVPALPVSRDVERHGELRRALVAYRLVFGQPRQDDLMAWLMETGAVRAAGELTVDLAPGGGEGRR